MKNKTRILYLTVLLIFIVSLVLVGCGPEQLDYEAVSGYADQMTENLLIGQNEYDYDKYSRDFNSDMLSAVTMSNFEGQIELLEEANYLPYAEASKEFLTAVPENGYVSVYYKIEILEERVVEGENKTIKSARKLKVVFEEVGREMKIAGYWYE